MTMLRAGLPSVTRYSPLGKKKVQENSSEWDNFCLKAVPKLREPCLYTRLLLSVRSFIELIVVT